MSTMSRNNSTTSLMGFSVHQPAIGAPLQFFPAMGSKQLDEMIDAYVPGHASILEKRTAVSLEFFEHSMATGDLFKFFMVYPALSSTKPSPAMDSSDYTSFSTSPASSDSRWTNPASQITSPSFSKKSTPANDFSNLPGMKIMTKDGRDVTNSASRGCKTKEQRDHAHLMRIIKACDSCRRKKTKCDPSHKRPSAGTSSGKVTKNASRKSRPAATSRPIPARQASTTPEFDQTMSASSSSLDSLLADPSLIAPMDGFSMEWDQFIQYDQEATEAFPYDFDLFFDRVDYLSPASGSFSSSSTSPSQLPITPIDRDVYLPGDHADGNNQGLTLPYLHPNLVDAGGNYVDFNLYSPPPSLWDEEPGFVNEVAASPVRPLSQSLSTERSRSRRGATLEGSEGKASTVQRADGPADQELSGSYRRDVLSSSSGSRILHDTIDYIQTWPEGMIVFDAVSHDGVIRSPCASPLLNRQDVSYPERTSSHHTRSVVTGNTWENTAHEALNERDTLLELALSRSQSNHTLWTDRPQPIVMPDTTATATASAQGLQHSRVAATPMHSISPPPHTDQRCGQDDETRAGLSAATPTYTSQSTTATRVPVVVAQPGNLSHISEGVGNAALTDSAFSLSTTRLSSALGRFHKTKASTPFIRHSLTEQRRGSTVLSASPIAVCNCFPLARGFDVVTSESMPSSICIQAPANIDYSMPLATLTLAAYITKGCKYLVKDALSVYLGIGVSCVLLCAAVVCRPWLLASLVAIWLFSLGERLPPLQGNTTSLGAKEHMTNLPSSQELSSRTQHHFLVKHWEATATKVLRLVRCGLFSKLSLLAHPRAPLTAGPLHRRTARGAGILSVLPLPSSE